VLKIFLSDFYTNSIKNALNINTFAIVRRLG